MLRKCEFHKTKIARNYSRHGAFAEQKTESQLCPPTRLMKTIIPLPEVRQTRGGRANNSNKRTNQAQWQHCVLVSGYRETRKRVTCGQRRQVRCVMGENSNSAEVFEIIMDGNDVVVTEEQDNTPQPPNNNGSNNDYDDLDDTDNDSTYDADLSWRSDPKVSLSDWTIQVVPKGSTSFMTYHCHKSVLAVGPKRSHFFAATFAKADQEKSSPNKRRNGEKDVDPCDFLQDTLTMPGSQMIDYTDHTANTTRLEVERLAAQAFPVLLDYMYSVRGDLDINTENATALFALSAQLGIKSLRRKVKDFWTGDLCMENISTYYGHARVFKDNKILSYAEDYCAKHIFEVKETLVVEILTAVDPHFFLRVVTSTAMQGDEQAALRLSLLIAVYGNIHKNELTPSIFLRLTAATHLPTVEVKAASVLLELEEDICQTSDRMTSLKERALSVISKNWEEACFLSAPANPENETEHSIVDGKICSLPRVCGHALEVFTKQVISQAKRDRASNAQELKELRAFKTEHQEAADREERLKKELEAARAEIDELKATNESMIKAHKTETENLRQTKLKLTAEVNELRKSQALQEDMNKLKRVASGGASSLLRSKDNHQ